MVTTMGMQSVILQFWEAQEAHSPARALSPPQGHHGPWFVTFSHDDSAPGLAGIKICIFCELTDSLNYPGFPTTCGDDEDFFGGQGMVPGLGSSTKAACNPLCVAVWSLSPTRASPTASSPPAAMANCATGPPPPQAA